jgi:hypothetical protein
MHECFFFTWNHGASISAAVLVTGTIDLSSRGYEGSLMAQALA